MKYPCLSLHSTGEKIKLKGAVFKVKALSGFAFLQLFSHQKMVQCIFEGDFSQTGIKEGSCLEIEGEIREASIKDPFIFYSDKEILITTFKILSSAKAPMPFDITKKILNIKNDLKLDFRPLSLRHPKERAIFVIQAKLLEALREFLGQENFIEIRSPKIVKEGAEGGANIFEFEYFGKKAYLTQSPQFYKEFCVGVFERVFEIAPVFRAEKHNTNRHLNEYTSIDLEMGLIDSFYDIMAMETAALKFVLEKLQQTCAYELSLLGVTLVTIGDSIPCLKFWEAKKIVQEYFKLPPDLDEDLSPLEEQKICEYVQKNLNSDFVFITHFPTNKRPFYAMDCPENPNETLSFDLLFRGVEITTGGQRVHDYDQLVEKMKRRGMNPEDFSFFTIAHYHGLPPHGGLGLGLERLTQKLLGLENVKEATLFPRDITRLTP